MNKLEYTLRFNTPAFLGNAEQSGQWRTPPFKAQLRQWWRMVWAADHGFTGILADMRREEGLLFGNAWLEDDFRKSLVRLRLRLDRWDEGKLKKQHWPADSVVTHPEVRDHQGRIKPVGSALYLGYGPLEFQGGTRLKRNAAIQDGETATISLAFPQVHDAAEIKRLLEENAFRIEHALWLMHRYGTVGGRSRNGWGSYELSSVNGTPKLEGQVPLREWEQCLDLDWPHAIGQDGKGPLIWQTALHGDWKTLMKTLAGIKIGLRTQFQFTTGRNAPNPEARHWLSYPVTNHSVQPWGNNARLPNQLRFKVRQTNDGKLVGVIFHVPHLPPPAFDPDRPPIERVWQRVHAFLDAPAQNLTRISE